METPLEISYSKIQAYLRCPWLYQLVYIQGWRTGPNGPQAFGNSIHRALAAYLSGDNKEKTEARLLEFLDQEWVNEGYSSTELILESYDRARTLLKTFFKNDPGTKNQTIATEKDFQIDLGEFKLRGTVDRIDRESSGSYTLIEYKTHQKAWEKSRVDTDLQGTLYDWGLQKGLGYKPLKLKYYFLSTGTWVETHRSPEQREEARTTVFDVANRIKKKDFEPNLRYCEHCEFSNRCSKTKTRN